MKLRRMLMLLATVLFGIAFFASGSCAKASGINQSQQKIAQQLGIQMPPTVPSSDRSSSPKGIQKRTRIVNNRLRINAKLPRFHRITSFPDRFRGGRFPQSLNLSPNEQNLYLGFDSYVPDGSKIIQYNLRTHHFRTGPTFRGGHAQGVALNPRTNRIWMINRASDNLGDDHAGMIKRGSFVEVSSKTLRPIYHHRFALKHNIFSNTLTFTKNGSFIITRMKHNRGWVKSHMLLFYYNPDLDQHGAQWRRLPTVIRHSSHWIIVECLAYNPHNNHLYIETEIPDQVWSLPVDRLLNNTLKPSDIKIARVPFGEEPEGMAFTKSGYVYMMVGGRSPWRGVIYKSNRSVGF